MSTISLAVQLFASMLALMACYAILMSIFKKEVSAAWVRGESAFALAASGVALAIGFRTLFDGGGIFMTASILLLILGFANVLALVVMHWYILKTGAVYRESMIPVAKWVAGTAFCALLLHVLTQFAAIAGF